MRIMLAGALRGVPGKHNGVYPRPLRQRGADNPLAQHSHSTDSLIVIGLLSHFSSDTPDCCELQHPMRSLLQVMESETDTPVIKGKACRMPSLRAPLIPLPFDSVVPTPGIFHTNVGYSSYRCLVFDVPTFGTRRTNVWYPSYLPLVLAVPSTGTELVSLSN